MDKAELTAATVEEYRVKTNTGLIVRVRDYGGGVIAASVVNPKSSPWVGDDSTETQNLREQEKLALELVVDKARRRSLERETAAVNKANATRPRQNRVNLSVEDVGNFLSYHGIGEFHHGLIKRVMAEFDCSRKVARDRLSKLLPNAR